MIIQYDLPSPACKQSLRIFVRALTAYNQMWLAKHPDTPDLYASGVRYATQPVGMERFKTIPGVLEAGNGDCDQLACWRAAELRVRHKVQALPEVIRISEGLWHVFVVMPDGTAEDVSAHLGMHVPAVMVAAGKKKLYGSQALAGRVAALADVRTRK